MATERSLSLNALVAITATLAGTAVVVDAYKRYRQLSLPPGPPEKPWFGGNVEVIPKRFPWLKFTEWAKKYGDVVHIRSNTQHLVILSSYNVAVDLLESRGALYSHRPQRHMAFLAGWERVASFRTYDDGLKAFRRHVNLGFSKRAAMKYHDGQTKDVHLFLQRLLSNPEDFVTELNWLAGSIIMRVTYGYSVTGPNDPFIATPENAFKSLLVAITENYLVDSYPSLQHLPAWLPGMGFKRQAEELRKFPTRMANEPFDWTCKRMNEGKAVPSFLSLLLEQNKDGSAGEDAIKWSAASMYAGGLHTTVATISNFIVAMMLYPEVARKAREEIDRVVGTERLPAMSDRIDLPYLECVLLETLRWEPVAPIAVPHCIIQEDEYQGHRIPANSTVYCNIYAITRDERIFPDPENFIPERFDANRPGPKPLNPRDFVFGVGRRICPGSHIADASIYLLMANLIAAVDVGKPRDENGNEYLPEVVRTGSPVNQVLPFKCSIKPRSDHAVQLINSAVMFDHE